MLTITTLVAAVLTSTPHSITSAQAAAAPLVVSTFAVPVGIPVAPLAPVWFSYSPGALRDDEAFAERIAQRVVRVLQDPAAKTPRPTTLVAQHCVKCHGGPNPKGSFALDTPRTLSSSQRLQAIRAVASGQMPPEPNAALAPDELRKLLSELAQP